MVSSMNKKFLYLILILFLPYSSYAWQEVCCSSINKEIDIIHGHYSPQKCWTNQYQGVESYFADFEKDGEYLWFEFQKTTDGKTWRTNSTYNGIHVIAIEDLISQYGFGHSSKVDREYSTIKSSNNKIRYDYRYFETSDGKGVYGGSTRGKFFYMFGFFTWGENTNLDENFLSEIISSLKMNGLNKGQNSSIRPSITQRKKERN